MTDSSSNELLQLSRQLLDAIDARDLPAYEELCDPSLTAFEPEASGHLVEGMAFHEFYLSDGPDEFTRQSTISTPHVRRLGEVAIVSYVRLLQTTDGQGVHATDAMEETRVWHHLDGRWQHVHFHRSPAGLTSP
ncbi:MAG: DUF4440 domain-containing protein [Planctomycetaceae bacterium]|nr:DUF4440 domain-containing protein [Planctomycetaceae bacterium]